jgi:TetR/AcrR family transcriptional regulator, transcriptional repressor for nem operon
MVLIMARLREFDTDAAVDAAVEVFRSRGYEAASVQDLVDATGVGRGSLYAAFDSKEGIYRAALERYRARYADPLVELLECGRPAREVIREVLTALVDEIVGDRGQRSCLIVGAAVEMIRRDADVARQVGSTTRRLEDAFAALIEAAQARGEIASQHPARDLARFVIATIHGLRVLGAIRTDRGELMATVEVALAALG